MKRLTLRRGFSWTLVGNAVYAACQWGALVVIARFTTPESVGTFALALAVVTPIFILANLQLRALQATDALSEHPASSYVWLRLGTSTVAILTVAAVTWLAGFSEASRHVIWIITAAKTVESISDVLYGRFQQLERMDWVSRSLMLRGVSMLVFVFAAAAYSGQLIPATVAIAASNLLVLILHDAVVVQRIDVPRHRLGTHSLAILPSLIGLMRAGLPLGLAMMISSANSSLPRILIERMIGERELGVFAAIAYFVVAGGTLVSALGQASSPRLSQYLSRSDVGSARQLLARLMLIAAMIGGLGVALAASAGPLILSTTYGDEYAAGNALFVWIMVYGAVTYVASILGFGMTAARVFLPQLPIAVSAVVVTGVMCVILIPRYGATGAALALLASAVVRAVYSWYVNHSALARKDNGSRPSRQAHS